MTAYFMVRAEVKDPAVKEDFDRWYRDEHLPDALKGFKARRAWRGWSAVDASVHKVTRSRDFVEVIQTVDA